MIWAISSGTRGSAIWLANGGRRRKRFCREQLVWVSPATVRRVLAADRLILRRPRRAVRSERQPFPQWASYTKHSIWIYGVTHFAGCPRVAVITIMELVIRQWICEVVSGEETATQIRAAHDPGRRR